ncbi:unnamed protein product [Heligmosomoides polygyrus]|uniref:DUF5641 domain-containing protein n=1 Tax=Heligmosomoides polygyrus TaxID=6339 RepID=A0A183FRR5_HELPZ|nr:unnamed protein product [Heligmosomoides polygyrus]
MTSSLNMGNNSSSPPRSYMRSQLGEEFDIHAVMRHLDNIIASQERYEDSTTLSDNFAVNTTSPQRKRTSSNGIVSAVGAVIVTPAIISFSAKEENGAIENLHREAVIARAMRDILDIAFTVRHLVNDVPHGRRAETIPVPGVPPGKMGITQLTLVDLFDEELTLHLTTKEILTLAQQPPQLSEDDKAHIRKHGYDMPMCHTQKAFGTVVSGLPVFRVRLNEHQVRIRQSSPPTEKNKNNTEAQDRILANFINTSKFIDGYLYVQFPWKEAHPKLQDNKQLAYCRLVNQYKKLRQSPQAWKTYVKLPSSQQPELQDASNKLTAWYRQSIRVLDSFWDIWHQDYLSALRERHQQGARRQRSANITPHEGQVVLMADDKLPRGQWPLRVITQIHAGLDGAARSASVRNSAGRVLQRSISHLYPLEISEPKASKSVVNVIAFGLTNLLVHYGIPTSPQYHHEHAGPNNVFDVASRQHDYDAAYHHVSASDCIAGVTQAAVHAQLFPQAFLGHDQPRLAEVLAKYDVYFQDIHEADTYATAAVAEAYDVLNRLNHQHMEQLQQLHDHAVFVTTAEERRPAATPEFVEQPGPSHRLNTWMQAIAPAAQHAGDCSGQVPISRIYQVSNTAYAQGVFNLPQAQKRLRTYVSMYSAPLGKRLGDRIVILSLDSGKFAQFVLVRRHQRSYPVDFNINVNRSFVHRFYEYEFEPQFRLRCRHVVAEDPRMLLNY